LEPRVLSMPLQQEAPLKMLQLLPVTQLPNRSSNSSSRPVIMVGGTSLIEGLVYAMGQLLQTEIVVPPYSQYIGAVGSALLASGFVQGE